MKKRNTTGLLLTALSASALGSAEAAQSFGEKSGALSTFQTAHPLLMISAHIGVILLLVGFFALMFTCFSRNSNKF
jgi:hypothetical protein